MSSLPNSSKSKRIIVETEATYKPVTYTYMISSFVTLCMEFNKKQWTTLDVWTQPSPLSEQIEHLSLYQVMFVLFQSNILSTIVCLLLPFCFIPHFDHFILPENLDSLLPFKCIIHVYCPLVHLCVSEVTNKS